MNTDNRTKKFQFRINFMSKIILYIILTLVISNCKFFKNAEKSYEKALQHINKEEYESAIPFLKEAIEINPKEEKYHIDIVKSYKSSIYKNNYNEEYHKGLIDSLNLAMDNFPDNLDFRRERGFQYCVSRINNYEKGLSDYTLAIEKESNNYVDLLYRSKCYVALGKNKEALDDLNRALKIDPNSYSILSDRAELYKSTGEYDKSINDLLTISKSQLEDNNPIAYVQIGDVYVTKKEYSNAIEYYQKYLDLFNQNEEALDKDWVAWANFGIAKSMKELGDSPEQFCVYLDHGNKISVSATNEWSSEMEEACNPNSQTNE
jgi:tetratricopeptide (TPR) repeat protein